MLQENVDYHSNLTKKYKKESIVTKDIKRLNSIAANFIRNTSKIQEDSCQDMVILTEKILEQNFQSIELENILNKKDDNKMIYFLDKNDFQNVMSTLRENRNKGDLKKKHVRK